MYAVLVLVVHAVVTSADAQHGDAREGPRGERALRMPCVPPPGSAHTDGYMNTSSWTDTDRSLLVVAVLRARACADGADLYVDLYVQDAQVHHLGARPPRHSGAARWWRHPSPATYLLDNIVAEDRSSRLLVFLVPALRLLMCSQPDASRTREPDTLNLPAAWLDLSHMTVYEP